MYSLKNSRNIILFSSKDLAKIYSYLFIENKNIVKILILVENRLGPSPNLAAIEEAKYSSMQHNEQRE